MNFDDFANNWDTERRTKRAKIIADEIAVTVNAKENSSAMEFGSGTGLISFNLKDNFSHITLIDISKFMIDNLDFKIENNKINNMVTRQIDIIENDIDEKFDVIYSSMALHHIKDTNEILGKFYKLLNSEGYLCIVDLDEEDGSFHKNDEDFDGHNGFNQEELKQMLINIGFRDVEANTFFKDKKIIDGEEIEYSLFILKAEK